MGKSLGNALEVSSVVEVATPLAVRYYLTAAHYRSTIEYHEGSLIEARATVERIAGFLERVDRMRSLEGPNGVLPQAFRDAMDDDLNVSGALAVVHDTVRAGNTALDDGDDDAAHEAATAVVAMTEVLGVNPLSPVWDNTGPGGADDALAGARRARRRPARCAPVGPRRKGFRDRRRDPRPPDRGWHRHRRHALRGALVVGPTGRWLTCPVTPSAAERYASPARARPSAPAASVEKRWRARDRRPRPPSASTTRPPRSPAAPASAARPARKPGYASGSRPQGRTAGRSGRSGGSAKASSEIVAGRNAVVEALRADIPVTTMYVAGRIDADDRVREALKTATERRIPVLETPRGELDRLTDGAVHQGLALQVPPYAYVEIGALIDPEAPGIPLVVALDGVTDPRNLGAVVRSVAAFGGHGVLLPERRSAGMTASAWKTSAGAAARVPVARVPNLTRALEAFQKAGFFVLGLDMDGDVELPGLALATEPVVVVVGFGGQGPVPAGPRDLRPGGVDPDVVRGRVAQRRRRRRGHAVRDRPAARRRALTRIPTLGIRSRTRPADRSRSDRLPWAPWRRARGPTTSD